MVIISFLTTECVTGDDSCPGRLGMCPEEFTPTSPKACTEKITPPPAPYTGPTEEPLPEPWGRSQAVLTSPSHRPDTSWGIGGRLWTLALGPDACPQSRLLPALAVTQRAPVGVAWPPAALHSSPCSSPREALVSQEKVGCSTKVTSPGGSAPSLGNNLELSRDQEDGVGVAALPRAPPGGQTWGVPRFPFEELL